jgi:hypothetical protein
MGAEPLLPRETVRISNGKTININEAIRLTFKLGRYSNTRLFKVLDLPKFDVILGKDWLKEANPRINWRTETYVIPHNGQKITVKRTTCEKNEDDLESIQLISAKQYRRTIKQAECLWLLDIHEITDNTQIMERRENTPANLKNLLQEFRDVFPAELPGKVPLQDRRLSFTLTRRTALQFVAPLTECPRKSWKY